MRADKGKSIERWRRKASGLKVLNAYGSGVAAFITDRRFYSSSDLYAAAI
jgi:hypothetical protein